MKNVGRSEQEKNILYPRNAENTHSYVQAATDSAKLYIYNSAVYTLYIYI